MRVSPFGASRDAGENPIVRLALPSVRRILQTKEHA
jgi:hypothetical protein